MKNTATPLVEDSLFYENNSRIFEAVESFHRCTLDLTATLFSLGKDILPTQEGPDVSLLLKSFVL